jgi:ribosomal protein L37AE/L43A
MKYLKLYEGKLPNKFSKSSYTFRIKATSKIDPTRKVVIKIFMKCPVCGTEMSDMTQGEIRRCQKCKTEMQTYGNGITINQVNVDKYKDNFKRFHNDNDSEVEYTKTYTREHLVHSDYRKGDMIRCPLCDALQKDIKHGQHKTCKECGLEMISYGNDLDCKIDNIKLELYQNIRKYNL